MTRIRIILPVLALSFAAWGCNRATPSAAVDQVKPLEARIAKLEQEAKSLAGAKAELASKLAAADARGKAAEQDRDAARADAAAKAADLAARTAERDSTQAEFDGFRKNIRDLLGKADLTATQRQPVVAVPASRTAPAAGKSSGL